jgi:hypothetical protein
VETFRTIMTVVIRQATANKEHLAGFLSHCLLPYSPSHRTIGDFGSSNVRKPVAGARGAEVRCSEPMQAGDVRLRPREPVQQYGQAAVDAIGGDLHAGIPMAVTHSSAGVDPATPEGPPRSRRGWHGPWSAMRPRTPRRRPTPSRTGSCSLRRDASTPPG